MLLFVFSEARDLECATANLIRKHRVYFLFVPSLKIDDQPIDNFRERLPVLLEVVFVFQSLNQ